jgi:cell division protein ZapA
VRSVGQIGDARLLVMASLLIADELAETDQALSQLKAEASAAAPLHTAKSEEEAAMATALDGLAARLEAIADALERD